MTQPSTLVLAALAASISLSPAAHAQVSQICDVFGTVDIPNSTSKEYVVQNNFWNQGAAGGTQCISVNSASRAFTITTAPGPVPTNGPPASYPSIFKGCHWGNCTNNSGLPLQVSNIATADAHWAITPKTSGQWDAALDIWFHQSATASGQPNGAEIMIWLNHLGAPQPVGSVVASNVSIAGSTWNVWFGNVGWNVISYVRVTPGSALGTPSSPTSLKPFFADAQARGYLQPSWWLIGVEAGFEPWQDGLNLASSAFAATFTSGSSNPGSQTLSVSKSGTGTGTVSSTPSGIQCGSSCSAGFASGTTVTLSAAASAGSTFAGWSGACAGTGACTVSMTQGRSVSATFNTSGGSGGCPISVTPVVLQNQPWYNEEAVRLDNTGTLTALNVSLTIQRSPGVTFSGQYNTVGATQSNSSTSAAITYTFSLPVGQTIGPGSNRRFVGQTSGTGTLHPTTGDTYTVSASCGSATNTSSGTF